ncbi:MAG: pyridoxal 5'-phosphate synthase glutaminase subunit PdxT [Bryobacterales bacterium]|nr:pyridoxal 5'-phosphate synthase glutaminase subunit PdxT [Bryobacterales bacterium]
MAHIGVLALQGDYEKHSRSLARVGAQTSEVRTAAELEPCDGLVIPGGESTSMLKLLDREGLFEPLRRFGARKFIFGTCAGAILLATRVENPEQPSLGLVDIAVRRNAYGRQLDSRVASIAGVGFGSMEAVFIRAPIILSTGPAVRVLARYGNDPVLVEDGRHVVSTFHPELSNDDRVHAYFLKKVTG